MDSHRVSKAIPTTLTIAGITFDRVLYDREADVLYLHRGEPATAAEFDATPEGHHVRFDADGAIVGLTLVNPRWLLENDGSVVITLPGRTVSAPDVRSVVAA